MYKDNFYFRYLDIDYDPNDIVNFLKIYPLIESRFQQIDIKITKLLVPSIISWFEKHDIEATTSISINHAPQYRQNIHKDVLPNDRVLAINFPLNYEAKNSITSMYSIKGEDKPIVKMVQKGGTELPYYYYEEDQVELVTEYKSISPVLVNVSKPHSAWNNTEYTRGVLTFRFSKDPVNLLEHTE